LISALIYPVHTQKTTQGESHLTHAKQEKNKKNQSFLVMLCLRALGGSIKILKVKYKCKFFFFDKKTNVSSKKTTHHKYKVGWGCWNANPTFIGTIIVASALPCHHSIHQKVTSIAHNPQHASHKNTNQPSISPLHSGHLVG
jgi:hypothetical protein